MLKVIVMGESKIKTVKRFYYTPIRMAKIEKNLVTPIAGEAVEEAARIDCCWECQNGPAIL